MTLGNKTLLHDLLFQAVNSLREIEGCFEVTDGLNRRIHHATNELDAALAILLERIDAEVKP